MAVRLIQGVLASSEGRVPANVEIVEALVDPRVNDSDVIYYGHALTCLEVASW
jgi:hypothetical protein